MFLELAFPNIEWTFNNGFLVIFLFNVIRWVKCSWSWSFHIEITFVLLEKGITPKLFLLEEDNLLLTSLKRSLKDIFFKEVLESLNFFFAFLSEERSLYSRFSLLLRTVLSRREDWCKGSPTFSNFSVSMKEDWEESELSQVWFLGCFFMWMSIAKNVSKGMEFLISVILHIS